MRLKLENIGMLSSVDINLDALTVIAGENDTGKSTVGKLIFSIIKAMGRYKEDLEENRDIKIKKLLDAIYFRLRNNIAFSNHIELREMFHPRRFIKDIDTRGLEAISKRKDYLEKNLTPNLFNEDATSKDRRLTRRVIRSMNSIEKIISQEDDKKTLIKNAFQKAIFSEFQDKIFSINPNKPSKIEIFDFENPIIKIEFKDGSIDSFEIYDDLFFSDSTFIDSPIVLHMNELIERAKTYFHISDKEERLTALHMPNIILHTKDLITKLKESLYGDSFLTDILFPDIDAKISSIINGSVKYDKSSKDFLFLDKEGNQHKSINTASGIKSFGIIQLLVKSGFLNENSFLILDEPEVHLHPKWQLKYAEIITQLAKNGITVLVTTHSPYMVEALQKYSEIEHISSDFYLAENGTITEDDKSLEMIFHKLSEPFEEFEEIDLSALKHGKI